MTEVLISKVRLENGVTVKLKTCPNCGSHEVYVQQRGRKYQVKCWWDITCRQRSGWFSTLDEAVKKWNT